MNRDLVFLQQLSWFASVAALLTCLWAVALWANQRQWFPIRQVVVTTPLSEVDAGLLESVVRNEWRGSFFSFSPQKARASLRKLPWVKDARVTRRWPGRIEVAIVEQKVLGQWSEQELLAQDGEIFKGVARVPLPRFEAQSASPQEVVKRYLEARRQLAAIGLQIDRMGMSERGGVWIETREGLRIEFGREQFAERLQRFIAVYAQLATIQRQNLRRVDLRYRSALALTEAPLATASTGEDMHGAGVRR